MSYLIFFAKVYYEFNFSDVFFSVRASNPRKKFSRLIKVNPVSLNLLIIRYLIWVEAKEINGLYPFFFPLFALPFRIKSGNQRTHSFAFRNINVDEKFHGNYEFEVLDLADKICYRIYLLCDSCEFHSIKSSEILFII